MAATWGNPSPFIEFWETNLNEGDIDCAKYKMQMVCTEIEDAEYEMIE